MSASLIIEQALNGLQFGVMLFLMSAGLTLVFGVMGLINLAHGSLYMIGAFAAAIVAAWTGSFWFGLAASLMAAAIAGALVLVLTLGTLFAVATRAEVGTGLSAADWAAVRFTISQAFVSAALSVGLAIPVARGLARRSFVGRGALITLLGAPFLLPVIVAVMGLLAVFGRSGWVSQLLEILGLPPIPIYGFHGVVIAHVFFNLPLATRIILQGWTSIPAERFRLAAQLGFSGRDMARHLEWPMLMRAAPGAFAIIFAICLSSFAVALTLGGGPRATTVELAIYQAFRFDFDLGKAALLSALQLLLAGTAALLALWLSNGQGGFGGGGGGQGNFSDIFGDVFGDIFGDSGGSSQRRSADQRGNPRRI